MKFIWHFFFKWAPLIIIHSVLFCLSNKAPPHGEPTAGNRKHHPVWNCFDAGRVFNMVRKREIHLGYYITDAQNVRCHIKSRPCMTKKKKKRKNVEDIIFLKKGSEEYILLRFGAWQRHDVAPKHNK
jgi:hypothetical protein